MNYKITPQHKVFLNNFYSPAWNLCSYCFLHRDVSFDTLEIAMNEVVRKNDALRMAVLENTVSFSEYNPRHYERVSFKDEREFLVWAHKESNKPVAEYPGMWTAYLIEIDGRHGVFNIGHHIMCDAMNVVNLYQKIIDELDGHGKEDSYINHLNNADAYLNSKSYEKNRVYWDNIITDEMPLAFSGRSIGECNNIDISLPSVRDFCERYGFSEAAFMYAATGLFLLRIQQLNNVSLGIPVLGRTTQREINSLGLFMRDVPMILYGGEKSFIELVQEVENNQFDLFRHQRFALPNKPLFDVSADYSEYPKTDDYEAHIIYNNYVSTAMEFHFLQREQLVLTIRSQKGIFRNLQSVAETFKKLTDYLIVHPESSIWKVPIAELPQPGEVVDIPAKSLYSLIENRHSGRIIENNREYTLEDLKRSAEKVDAVIRGEKRVIGVLCERSYIQLTAIYGIIRGGNAYLPISPDYPSERIRLLLDQSKCDTVLVQRKFALLFPDGLIIENMLECEVLSAIPPSSALPDDPLYVIFTSGSTGTPKGASVSNRSAVNRILWMCRKYFSPETVVMLKTPFTFDVSVWELFGFALGGFSLCILPPEDHYRQDKVIECIRRGKVTDLHFVPTVFERFLDELNKGRPDLPTLKNIFLSGEALSASLVNRSPAPVHNLYGPTECAVDVTSYDCKDNETDPVPIGRPIDNCQIYVLDKHLQPLPPGSVGQICIGGIPVGLGYLNDPETTEKAFVQDPFGKGKIYLTGDLGYWREDGQLIFVGRNDQQVKINGQRIELGEIETAMSTLVSAAAVITDKGRLTAFYTGEIRTDLREKLSRILPRYMIPHSFVHIDEMPLTLSGKMDRRALASISQRSDTIHTEPNSDAEKALIEAVRQTLSLTEVGISENFYEIGGDSLSALYVITLLQDRGYDITASDFLKSNTLSAAAAMMKKTTVRDTSVEGVSYAASPIIQAYLYEKPSDTASFVQSCLIPIQADEKDVRRALDLVVERHEMLRAKFSEDGSFSIGCKSYSFKNDTGPATFEHMSFDISNGPLVDAVLYPGYLRLTIHHFAVDAVSWKIIIDDLKSVLNNVVLPAMPYRYSEYISTAYAVEYRPDIPDMLPLIHKDDPVNPEQRYSFKTAPASNELLLTALGIAANRLAGGKAGICVETNGRNDPRYVKTVGWFTAVFPIVTESSEETERVMSDVLDIGTGYLATYGHLPENASILYNFTPVIEDYSLGPISLFPGKINVNCLKTKDGISVDIGIPEGHHKDGIAEKLGAEMEFYLKVLRKAAGQKQPQNEVEDIYDLTPTQLGMYRNRDFYNLSYTVELDKAIDLQRFENALNKLMQRHQVLRSSFIKQDDGSVKQYVFKNPPTNNGPDSLFRTSVDGACITVATHHIILDGWSLSIIVKDLLKYYNNPDTPVTETVPFSRYEEWLRQLPDGTPYWKSLLSGCGTSSDLPHKTNAVGCHHKIMDRVIYSDGVERFAREHRVSVNTVLETAFSVMLLQRNERAIFGKMVSGRNAPIYGISETVGPFTNMIPVFIKDERYILSEIHRQSVAANDHGFTPLAELYEKTDLCRINILFVFENYPPISGVKITNYSEENEFDLTFTVRETFDGFTVRVSYAPEKYEFSVIDKSISDFSDAVQKLVSGVGSFESRILPVTEREYAPVGELERIICELFERVLERPTYRFDNFYDLGGTSLNLAELLTETPLDSLSPSEFMHNPTPAGLAEIIANRPKESTVIPLYVPDDTSSAYILFPFGGGDAAAYTALVSEFRKRGAKVALFFVPWGCDYSAVTEKLRSFSIPVRFYSHCAGAVMALKLLDCLDCIDAYIAGASIPPENTENIWKSLPDETIIAALRKAGMPELLNYREAEMLREFRTNTEEYFEYLRGKTDKTHVRVSVVLGTHDVFTDYCTDAVSMWVRYVDGVDTVRYIESSTHYFQSESAAELADILLEE